MIRISPYVFPGVHSKHLIASNNIATSDTLLKLLRATAEYYDVPQQEIKSVLRTRNIVQARSIFIYLALKHTDSTLIGIGKMINKDHSTVIHSRDRINGIIDTVQGFSVKKDVINIEMRMKE